MVAAKIYLLAHLLISAVIASAWIRADLRLLPYGRLAKSFCAVFIGWPFFLAATAEIMIAEALPRRAADRLTRASHGDRSGASDAANAATTP